MSDMSRFDKLAGAAERYGRLSLDNYAIVRNVAENVSAGFCRYLGESKGVCVHLVPPEGPWLPRPYRSGAFSVSGTGFLPLGPIAFGLAVKVSNTGDWIRLVLTCAKKGHHVEVVIAGGPVFDIDLPVEEADLIDVFDRLHAHLVRWFTDAADLYEHGDYGGQAIGFDFLHNPLGESGEDG
ncbi:hypothetical protein [Maricaulis sp.]|uniref:hypothetical protein n=1 Tax=Maricaulis sp. TaxID=1486257 RepID=UPI002609AF1A|nr:hypothetical protein [Maricaulis sp.]